MTVQLRMIDAGISNTSNGYPPKEKIQSVKMDILNEISDKTQSIHDGDRSPSVEKECACNQPPMVEAVPLQSTLLVITIQESV